MSAGFRLFFAGAEQPVWRRTLLENGARAVSISFRNLLPRLPKTKDYLLTDRYPDDIRILVDSGAYGLRDMSKEDAEDYMRRYRQFIEVNEERLDFVTELDAVHLGDAWLQTWREDFWHTLPEDKFMPVWHTEYGPDVLEDMSSKYGQVAVVGDVERSQSRINGVVARHGVGIHGAAVTKPDLLMSVKFRSASSTSWISPMKFGDTIVWDGHRLRRYPKAYKEQSRKRHRMLFERAGFDPEAIAADDPKEVARLTVWSWLQLEAAVARRRGDRSLQVVPDPGEGDVVAMTLDEDEVEWDQKDPSEPDGTHLPTRNINVAPTPRHDGERMTLPVMGFRQVRTMNPTSGENTDVPVPVSQHRSLRRCDSCYVAASCPAMTPGAECAFDLPLEIRTKEQLTGTLTTMLEMQAQRVAFARYSEELEGGYPDPNLSGEMDRFFKMTALLKEIEDNRDFFKVQVEARGNAGVLSAIFGERVGEQARQLPKSVGADDFDKKIAEIVDGEIVE